MIRLTLAVVALLITMIPSNGVAQRCESVAVVASELHVVRQPGEDTRDVFATTTITATNTVFTDTINLSHGWRVTSKTPSIWLRAPAAYTMYLCQAGFKPKVAYLPLP